MTLEGRILSPGASCGEGSLARRAQTGAFPGFRPAWALNEEELFPVHLLEVTDPQPAHLLHQAVGQVKGSGKPGEGETARRVEAGQMENLVGQGLGGVSPASCTSFRGRGVPRKSRWTVRRRKVLSSKGT